MIVDAKSSIVGKKGTKNGSAVSFQIAYLGAGKAKSRVSRGRETRTEITVQVLPVQGLAREAVRATLRETRLPGTDRWEIPLAPRRGRRCGTTSTWRCLPPGESNGRPLTLPVVPPGFDQLQEADRERFAQYAAGALGSMIGFKTSDADKGQRAILAKAIETLASAPGSAFTVPVPRDVIEQHDDALLDAIGGLYMLGSNGPANQTVWQYGGP